MNPELEKEFKDTCKILLGSELGGKLDDYGAWLGRHVPLPYPAKSAVSGKEVWLPPSLNYLKKKFNLSRIVSMDEMDSVNKTGLKPGDLKNATFRDMATRFSRPVSFYCGNCRYWEFENFEKISGGGAGRNVYYGEDIYHDVKNIAYSNYALYCQNMFGCHGLVHSKFSIHAYNSANVTRCFEVDGCSNSSDLLFCHNSEALSNCIFCFNAKNLRYAVGNVEVGKEEYARIKKVLLDGVVSELKKSRNCGMDIYNVGCL